MSCMVFMHGCVPPSVSSMHSCHIYSPVTQCSCGRSKQLCALHLVAAVRLGLVEIAWDTMKVEPAEA